jgi:sugar-specific transcriptional regulator TrmB
MTNEGGHSLTRTVLENLGFRRNEIRVYLEALYIGEATISELAARVKLPRSSTQVAVKNLHKKGLVQCYLKRHRKIWLAGDPQVLITKIREQEESLRQVLPQMMSGQHHAGPKPTIRLFTGMDELMAISNDVLNTRQHIYGAIPWDVLLRTFGLTTLDIARKKYHKNYLKMHLLVTPSDQALRMKDRVGNDFLKIKFLPNDFHLRNAYYVYGDKMLITLLSSTVPVGVVIEDEDLTNSFRYIFNVFWQKAA